MTSLHERAEAFLWTTLTGREALKAEILEQAQTAGIRPRTLERAAQSLGVITAKQGFGGAMTWRLPLPPMPSLGESLGPSGLLTNVNVREEKPETEPESVHSRHGKTAKNTEQNNGAPSEAVRDGSAHSRQEFLQSLKEPKSADKSAPVLSNVMVPRSRQRTSDETSGADLTKPDTGERVVAVQALRRGQDAADGRLRRIGERFDYLLRAHETELPSWLRDVAGVIPTRVVLEGEHWPAPPAPQPPELVAFRRPPRPAPDEGGMASDYDPLRPRR